MKPNQKPLAARFGIAEWYGLSFAQMSPVQRLEFAQYKPDVPSRMTAAAKQSLAKLRAKAAERPLPPKELARLQSLEHAHTQALASNKICPFKGTPSAPALCTKKGGVCSLRLYEKNGLNQVVAAVDEKGLLRAVCPQRFHEGGTAFDWIGHAVMNSSHVSHVGEIGFLESTRATAGSGSDDVGRLDMILVDASTAGTGALEWVPAEIQAVYFSGPEMAIDFKAIAQDVADGSSGLIWPTKVRRPDYRSSGVKRLMPQLQIKVPTLRRWGRKMAVLVDEAFFQSLGAMDEASDLSNADIAWFRVRFKQLPDARTFNLAIGEVFYTTLEEAVKGLTAGRAVSQRIFEARILEKFKALATKGRL